MHEEFIRKSIELAITSGKNGNASFGAVLVHEGQIIASAENTEITGQGYGHAEYNLVIQAAAQFPESVLTTSTLYTSCTPCLRCTCSILAAGIPRIVYSVSSAGFARLIPEEYTALSCEEIAKRLELSHIEIVGPILEDEGLRAFEYWGGKHTPLADLLAHAQQARDSKLKGHPG
jgi:tRNA(adenine34) deaminase